MRIYALLACLFIFPLISIADTVVPSERVKNSVSIRSEPTSKSDFLGKLQLGESLTWVGSQGRWRQVQFDSDTTGWVSKSWTIRLKETAQTDPALTARKLDELRIHYLSIGSGSCTVVECPGENASPMIIDCGSLSGTRGANALDEVQAASAINEILSNHSARPNLALSHADVDHYNYVGSILDHLKFKNIWLGGEMASYPDPIKELLETQRSEHEANLNVNLKPGFHNNQMEMGDKLSCGAASVYVLTAMSGDSKNANSLVLSIDYGDFSAIFTGDAEVSTEKSAIENFDGAVKTTVLSGSHHGADTHGSNGSTKGATGGVSSWPEMTAPKVLVYSHGKRFGHPRCAITKNYHDTLAIVDPHPMHCGKNNNDNTPAPMVSRLAEYSTHVSGTVVITTDGEDNLKLQCSASVGCQAEIQL